MGWKSQHVSDPWITDCVLLTQVCRDRWTLGQPYLHLELPTEPPRLWSDAVPLPQFKDRVANNGASQAWSWCTDNELVAVPTSGYLYSARYYKQQYQFCCLFLASQLFASCISWDRFECCWWPCENSVFIIKTRSQIPLGTMKCLTCNSSNSFHCY